MLKICFVSALCMIFLGTSQMNADTPHCFKVLATSRAVAIVAVVAGGLSFLTNFTWAFNWAKHAGLSADDSATIQEIGGISASLVSLILCMIIPVMAYEANKARASKQTGV